ncbi:hypothetical protein Q1695_002745 [Nippostrongylus brasiliensis]|nr:hypothetical protein Q1695_002745 [Nippostrongylus brasiliensis]
MLALVIASFAALCHAGSVPLANARSGTAALPQAGPCTQNNDGMKCTKHGCHNSIKKMVGEGSITDGTFVPKCDAILGNFEPLQCDLKRKVCYCVDVQTGTEIANTRKSMAAKKSITCDGTEFSIDPEQFPSPVQSTMTADMRYPVAKESCRLDRNRGNTCRGAKASTRYFFDHTTFSCLSFEYLGCGGNDNNYKTSSDCYSNCMLRLTASSKPGPKLGKDGCPKDHKCVSGAFFGTCCSLANEDRFDAAYHPKCSNGRSAYAIDMGGWNSTVLGKSCKDNFCPHGRGVTGPCFLNDDEMKCTKKGYYETIQCDTRGCYCVAANTGFIAFDTKTSDPSTMPKCSACHNELKKIFADGDVPKDTFVPKCDVSMGNYEPLQCDPKQESCYCVNVNTGKKIANTRKRKEANKFISCGKTEYSIDPNKFPTTIPSSQYPQERYPVGKESCKFDRNRGTTCKEAKPSIRYYFDYTTFACLAFEYLGCGGNDNNYPTSSECASSCKIPDLSGCSGMYPVARGADGQGMTCGGPELLFPPGFPTPAPKPGPKLNEDGCPKDHKCVMGAFFGFCCSQANEDRFSAAYHPQCSNGRAPLTKPMDSWRETVFGKSCKDNFCPTGYKCQQGEIFAYCC